MGYTAWSVVFGEQPSASKWNILGANDASFNDGTGIGNDAITTAKIIDDAVTPPKMSVLDRFKHIPAWAYNAVIAGTWTKLSNTGTTISALPAAQSAGAANEEIEFRTVLEAGTYTVLLHTDRDINRGIYTIYVDGVSIGTYDSYSATRVVGIITSITTSLSVATNKEVTIRVKMATKNASSSGYYGTFYSLDFIKTA